MNVYNHIKAKDSSVERDKKKKKKLLKPVKL